MKNYVRIITFSGVDGAGKTTILREFTETLNSKYNVKVKELRHRPSVLPILSSFKYGKAKAEQRAIEVLPRTGSNSSKTSSYIRFFYYLLDYILGQWYIYFKYTRKNILVIYDRYYFDFINDARRTNIDLRSDYVRYFYKFIFEPEINIFLYASPQIIRQRKQEMDEESIELLTKKYLHLFKDYRDRSSREYICIENIDKHKTLGLIEDVFISLI